jgi:CHAP domain-containing protein
MTITLPLALTSPTMKGDLVRQAQRALSSSKYGDFKPGPLDGEFGEQAAGACRRAKFWLGYPKASITPIYGGTLRSYLIADRRLPLRYRSRRAFRLRRRAATPMRLRAFNEAAKHVGLKENPAGSNNVLFARWYRGISPANGWAWCAMFVTYCYVQAGSKRSFAKGSRYAYTPFMVHDARLGVNAMALLNRNQVLRGDIVMFDWGGAGQGRNPELTDHTGLFDAWLDPRIGTFKTIEGNTALGNESNGGQVMRRERSIGLVSAFIRAEV